MLNDEIYDSVLDELRSISESMRELQKMVSQEISIASANNILLRKLLEQRDDERNENIISNLDVDKYINKNLLIINFSKEEGLGIAKNISNCVHGRFVVSDAKSDSEFATMINRLLDEDIVFVDVSDPLFDNRMRKMLHECINDCCINISVGKGETARTIRMDIPKVKFIIYSNIIDFLPNGLQDKLIIVE